MNDRVFDSSVYLANLLGEPLQTDIYDLLEGSVISSVNFAEVFSKQTELGINARKLATLLNQIARIEPFTASQARLAASLRLKTIHAGLSLGDRACLALAIELGADIYTADRMWAKIDVPCKIHFVR